MPTLGLDCQIILDGAGYFLEPNSFAMLRARVRAATHTRQAATFGSGYGQGVGERYVDLGPGKREWHFTIPAYQAMRDYAGRAPTLTGQAIRDALHASYEKVNTTLSFTDPGGHTWTVHFDHLAEVIANVRAQADGELQYLCQIVLVEA